MLELMLFGVLVGAGTVAPACDDEYASPSPACLMEPLYAATTTGTQATRGKATPAGQGATRRPRR